MDNLTTPLKEFSSWRTFLWPIHRHEHKKFIPMLLMLFFISLDSSILKTLKDSLLVTAKFSGAEVIPFAKVWAVLPSAFMLTLLYTCLSNRIRGEIVIYIMVSIFMLYFFVFTFILYPIRDTIHPHAMADALEKILPLGFKGVIAMFRYWTFTLFYLISELWSSLVLFVLFWGFVNQVTKISESKRFYGLLSVGINLSGVFAGQISIYCCDITRMRSFFFGEDAWHQSLILLTSLILIFAFIALVIFRWMHVYVLTKLQDDERQTDRVKDEIRPKLSLKQSFSFVLSSKYLLGIAIIIICYNIAINLTEVLWKNEVRGLYPDANDYTHYMNQVVSIIGIIATLSSLILSGNAIRRFGWKFTALLTPSIFLIMGITFFSFLLYKQDSSLNFIASFFGLNSVLPMSVFLGSSQIILSRAAKYSVFDTTKEMLYVPLSSDSKRVGKAAIDGVCSRMGRSGGSVTYQALLLIFSTLSAVTPYVLVVFIIIIAIWMLTIHFLGKSLTELSLKTASPPEAFPSLQVTPV
jgi:AAA family ATP:ADP antiporter